MTKQLAYVTFVVSLILLISGCTQNQYVCSDGNVVSDPNDCLDDGADISEPQCGNDICENTEDCSNCPNDCGQCEPPKINELILQLSDVPEGNEILKKGYRIESDEQERDDTNSIAYGWNEGYYVEFTDDQHDLYTISNIVSRFPQKNISKWFQLRKDFVEDFYKYKSYGIVKKIYTLPDVDIGEDSITYRIDYEDTDQGKIDNYFAIEFIKSDIYEYIEGLDYDLILESARKIEEKIPGKVSNPSSQGSTTGLITGDKIAEGSITPTKLDREYCEKTGSNCPVFIDFQMEPKLVVNSLTDSGAGVNKIEAECPAGTVRFSCNCKNEQLEDLYIHDLPLFEWNCYPNQLNGCILEWNKPTAYSGKNYNHSVFAQCFMIRRE